MSRIVFRLFALKAGYPVLAYLPISDWEQRFLSGDLPEIGAPGDEIPPRLSRYREVDITPWLTAQLRLVARALDDLRRQIDHAEEADDDMRRRLDENSRLNHRQRSVLIRALRQRDATFTIGYHRTTHGISYPTAHGDLLELSDQGYLVTTKRGRAFVFEVSAELDRLLGSGAGSEADGER